MGRKILLVENDAETRTAFCSSLADDGFFVVAVTSGQLFDGKAGGRGFDLIVLGPGLPPGDQHALLQRLREFSGSVVATWRTADPTLSPCPRSGAACCLGYSAEKHDACVETVRWAAWGLIDARRLRVRLSWLAFLWALIVSVAAILVISNEGHGRARAQRRLEAFNDLLNCTQTGVVVVDHDGAIAEWSGGAESILGWTAEDVAGKLPYFYASREARREYVLALRDSVSAKTVIDDWALCKDGTRVRIYASIRSVPNHAGTYYLILFCRWEQTRNANVVSNAIP